LPNTELENVRPRDQIRMKVERNVQPAVVNNARSSQLR